MPVDPFYLIQETIVSIKSEINSLTDKYNNSVREIWIKLTELETNIKNDKYWLEKGKDSWYKSLPIIVSILALFVSISSLIRDFLRVSKP